MALVIIIEDNSQQCELYKAIIELVGGHRAETISTGTEGMARVHREPPPDVWMLDMHLPGIDGDQIFAAIRLRHPDTAIFVVTGDAQKAIDYKGIAEQVWLKPTVPAAEVLAAVELTLNQRGIATPGFFASSQMS